MAFEQATIKVEKDKEFGELRSAIVTAFSPENVQKFLKRVSSAGLRVRDLDSILAKGVFEQIDKFRSVHPLLQKAVTPQTLAEPAMVSFHPGAAKYLREKGLLK